MAKQKRNRGKIKNIQTKKWRNNMIKELLKEDDRHIPQFIALDVETKARKLSEKERKYLIDKIKKKYEDKEPPKNYKTDKAIESWKVKQGEEMEKEIKELEKNLALDPVYNEIICCAVAYEDGNGILRTKLFKGEESLQELLDMLFKAHLVITKSGFDKATIIHSAMRHNLYIKPLHDLKWIDISYYLGTKNEFGKWTVKSLKEYALVYLDVEYEMTGEDVDVFYENEDLEAIYEYNLKDAEVTFLLAKKVGII
jgi:hypothetical protein